MKKEYLILLLITLTGAFFRFYELGKEGLYTDEASVCLFSAQGIFRQEFIPELILWVFKPTSEFWIRFQFALAGTLTIPAMYFVVKEKKLHASAIVALFPLFIFYSRMGRPYALSGMFLVLSWRWWWWMIPAILTTPISIIGLKWNKKSILLAMAGLTVLVFAIRPDSDRDFISQIPYSSRFLYLPALALILYVYDMLLPKYRQLTDGIYIEAVRGKK